jgi:hypothetical protein
MRLPNFTFAEFTTLEPDYQQELKAFFDVAVWDGKVSGNKCEHLSQLSVLEVWYIRRVLRDGKAEALPEVVAMQCSMSTGQVYNSSAFEVLRAISKAVDEAIKLHKMEEAKLRPAIDTKMQQAVGDKLEQFDLYNTLDALTNRDRTKWAWAKKLKYQTAFTILHKDSVESEIQREYQRLIKNGTH